MLISFNGEYSAGSHIISIRQQCSENYDGRPQARVMDFVVKLRKGWRVRSVTSDSLTVSDIQIDRKHSLLLFRATLPSKNDSIDTITINL